MARDGALASQEAITTTRLSAVAETPSSIGYGDLAFARDQGSFTPTGGGKETARFWVLLQNNGLAREKETYSDPSTNGDSKESAGQPTVPKPPTPTANRHPHRRARWICGRK